MISLNCLNVCYRSTDTEDYMKIELASNQTACPEPPRPPPLPPPLTAANINGDTNGHNSKTNTLNSTANNIPAPPPPQDTATRKQQQPLSAISIQDLNSVQVSYLHRNRFKFFFHEILIIFVRVFFFSFFISFGVLKIKYFQKHIQRQHEVWACNVYHPPMKHFYHRKRTWSLNWKCPKISMASVKWK